MLASGEESILDCIFCVGCVPQEPKGPLVKHGQVARHDAAQFLEHARQRNRRELLAQIHWTFVLTLLFSSIALPLSSTTDANLCGFGNDSFSHVLLVDAPHLATTSSERQLVVAAST